jgi:hypothetical protein
VHWAYINCTQSTAKAVKMSFFMSEIFVKLIHCFLIGGNINKF